MSLFLFLCVDRPTCVIHRMGMSTSVSIEFLCTASIDAYAVMRLSVDAVDKMSSIDLDRWLW